MLSFALGHQRLADRRTVSLPVTICCMSGSRAESLNVHSMSGGFRQVVRNSSQECTGIHDIDEIEYADDMGR